MVFSFIFSSYLNPNFRYWSALSMTDENQPSIYSFSSHLSNPLMMMCLDVFCSSKQRTILFLFHRKFSLFSFLYLFDFHSLNSNYPKMNLKVIDVFLDDHRSPMTMMTNCYCPIVRRFSSNFSSIFSPNLCHVFHSNVDDLMNDYYCYF